MKTLAVLIKEWIKEKPNLRSVPLLAKLTGISKTTLYNVLKGECISPQLALCLGRALPPDLVAEAIRGSNEQFADVLARYTDKNPSCKGPD